jgi:hypothetical protein
VSDLDTLGFIINYQDISRKGQIKNFSDTVQFIVKKKKEIKAKISESNAIIEKPKAEIVHIYLPAEFEILTDTTSLRRRILSSDWKSDTKYSMSSDSMAFTDIYGTYNQTEEYEFATRDFEFYAKLNLNLTNINPFDTSGFVPDTIVPEKHEKSAVSKEEILKIIGDGNIILQLLDQAGKIIKEYNISENQNIPIDFLHPGKYGTKIIFDRNKNGKWDTGNYFHHIQPERVILNEKPIELKSNFETNIDWNIAESLLKSFTASKNNAGNQQNLQNNSHPEEK